MSAVDHDLWRPRPRLHLAQPDHGACEVNEAHEGGDGLLTAQGDAAEALELVEEALNLMAFLVEAPVDGRLSGSAGIGFDVGSSTETVGDEGA